MRPEFRVTGGLAYFRLRRDSYDAKAIDRWAGKVSETAEGSQECYVYLRHDETGENAILAAEAFREDRGLMSGVLPEVSGRRASFPRATANPYTAEICQPTAQHGDQGKEKGEGRRRPEEGGSRREEGWQRHRDCRREGGSRCQEGREQAKEEALKRTTHASIAAPPRRRRMGCGCAAGSHVQLCR